MTILELVLYLIVAGVSGAVGSSLAGYSHRGCLVSIALGFVGAILGSWMAGLLGLSNLLTVRIGDHPFPVVWSILGSALFVAVVSAMTRRRRPPPAA